MSDEDAELKDVLIRSLNETGILPRLQAQLRAAVYLALEKHNYHEKIPPANSVMRNLCSTEDGLIIVSLIAEFLSYANLGSTLEVLRHEAELDRLSLIDRPTLHSLLNFEDSSTAGATLLKLASTRRDEVRRAENQASSTKKDPTNTSAPNHYDQSVDVAGRSNGYADQLGSDSLTDSESRPSSSRSAATPSQNTGWPRPDSVDPLRHTPTNGPLSSQTTSAEPDCPGSNPRVNEIKATPSPRDLEYQDDFDSPRSPGSSKTVSSSPSPRVDLADRRNHSTSEKLVSDSAGGAAEVTANVPRTLTPVNHRLGILSSGSNEPGTNRCSSPSVIRVYTQSKKPSPSTESDSDVDGEDDDIPELVKELEYSGDEDTIDQTIDSDESLGLDHVEDVLVPRKPVTPSA